MLLLHLGGAVGVLCKHRRCIHRDAAISIQLLKSFRALIGRLFIVKYDYQHSIHDCFSPFEFDFNIRFTFGFGGSGITELSRSECRYRKKTTGALLGAEKAAAELRSLLYFPNVEGLALMCLVRALMRFWSF